MRAYPRRVEGELAQPRASSAFRGEGHRHEGVGRQLGAVSEQQRLESAREARLGIEGSKRRDLVGVEGSGLGPGSSA